MTGLALHPRPSRTAATLGRMLANGIPGRVGRLRVRTVGDIRLLESVPEPGWGPLLWVGPNAMQFGVPTYTRPGQDTVNFTIMRTVLGAASAMIGDAAPSLIVRHVDQEDGPSDARYVLRWLCAGSYWYIELPLSREAGSDIGPRSVTVVTPILLRTRSSQYAPGSPVIDINPDAGALWTLSNLPGNRYRETIRLFDDCLNQPDGDVPGPAAPGLLDTIPAEFDNAETFGDGEYAGDADGEEYYREEHWVECSDCGHDYDIYRHDSDGDWECPNCGHYN